MSAKPVLDERRLRRALESQGFRIEPARNSDSAAVVYAPDGERRTSVHFSNTRDRNSGRRSYRNMIASLVRIGFDLDLVDAGTNGDREDWKREREEVEQMIQAEQLELDRRAAAEEAEAEADAELRRKLEAFGPKTRDVYGLVRAEPGLHPRDYAERAGMSGAAISSHGVKLLGAGLIETTGGRATVRYWIAGEVGTPPADSATVSQNGRPSAGPVRIRQIEPGDPVVRYRKLAERASRLQHELDDVLAKMVDEYVSQETELRDATKRLRDLEGILGRAVDKL